MSIKTTLFGRVVKYVTKLCMGGGGGGGGEVLSNSPWSSIRRHFIQMHVCAHAIFICLPGALGHQFAL